MNRLSKTGRTICRWQTFDG